MTAPWRLEYEPEAVKWLKKADRQTARRIRNALRAIEAMENPRVRGKALTGPLSGLWRYRIGNYRIVCDLIDAQLLILVIEIDHRNNIYNDQ